MELELTEEQKLKSDSDFEKMNERFDVIEREVADLPPVELPLKHIFTPGLYSRTIFMPAGSLVTSKIHKTRHQFAVMAGEVTVWDYRNGTQLLRGPCLGITEPGTRRILFCHTDVMWTTFHATDKNTPQEVEDDILWHRINPLLTKEEPCLSSRQQEQH